MNKPKDVIGFPRPHPERTARRDESASSAAAGPEAGRGPRDSESDQMSVRLEAVAECGDRTAFTELFRHFAPRVRAYLGRGGGDAGRIDDVLQETFAAVWCKARLYDRRRATAAAWIFAIARNLRIDSFRREPRPEADPKDPAFRSDPAPEGDQALAAGQRTEAVRRALSALSDEQREVLWLSFYEGETYSQIAIRLGLPLGTVKSRARLAFTQFAPLACRAAGGTAMTIAHHVSEDLLLAYGAGTLDEATSILVATHLALCPSCRTGLDLAEVIGGVLMDGGEADHAADESVPEVATTYTGGDGEPAQPPSAPCGPFVLPQPLASMPAAMPANCRGAPWGPVSGTCL